MYSHFKVKEKEYLWFLQLTTLVIQLPKGLEIDLFLFNRSLTNHFLNRSIGFSFSVRLSISFSCVQSTKQGRTLALDHDLFWKVHIRTTFGLCRVFNGGPSFAIVLLLGSVSKRVLKNTSICTSLTCYWGFKQILKSSW